MKLMPRLLGTMVMYAPPSPPCLLTARICAGNWSLREERGPRICSRMGAPRGARPNGRRPIAGAMPWRRNYRWVRTVPDRAKEDWSAFYDGLYKGRISLDQTSLKRGTYMWSGGCSEWPGFKRPCPTRGACQKRGGPRRRLKTGMMRDWSARGRGRRLSHKISERWMRKVCHSG